MIMNYFVAIMGYFCHRAVDWHRRIFAAAQMQTEITEGEAYASPFLHIVYSMLLGQCCKKHKEMI